MSLATDIRYLTIPFSLLIAKFGIAMAKNKQIGNKDDKKRRTKEGGCGCNFKHGGGYADKFGIAKAKNKIGNKDGGCGCNFKHGGGYADISLHGSDLIDTINSLKNV